MYQSWILVSRTSNVVAVPTVSISGKPLVLIVEDREIDSFYKYRDKYYVRLRHTVAENVQQFVILANVVSVDVKDANEFLPSNNSGWDFVLRISADFSVPRYCDTTCDKVVLRIKGGSVLVPVTDIYKYYRFITEKFPACVELFAKDLVDSEEIATKAAELCTKTFGSFLSDCGSLRGHIAVAACTAVAARMGSHPLSIEELANKYNLPQAELYKAYKYIIEKLHISVKDIAFNTEEYIRYLASQIVKDPEKMQRVAEDALKFYELAKQHNITAGRDPKAIAAAAVYIVAQEYGIHVTQLLLARLTNSTEVTIRKRISELRALLKKLSNRSLDTGRKHG